MGTGEVILQRPAPVSGYRTIGLLGRGAAKTRQLGSLWTSASLQGACCVEHGLPSVAVRHLIPTSLTRTLHQTTSSLLVAELSAVACVTPAVPLQLGHVCIARQSGMMFGFPV